MENSQLEGRNVEAAALPVGQPDDAQWAALLARQAAAFVYAVTTTGVFCRTTCGSRRPLRANVQCFADGAAAMAAGFRACLRCRPMAEGSDVGFNQDALLVARVSRYLQAHAEERVSLQELGRLVGVSAFTVQRRFRRTTGVSPQDYARGLRAQALECALQQGIRVTDAVYAAGFSAPSRAVAATPLGMTAKAYRAHGRGERIGYAVHLAPGLGQVLVAGTERGVCAVLLGDDEAVLRQELAGRFSAAELTTEASLDAEARTRLLAEVQVVLAALRLDGEGRVGELPLDLRGTVFQARVWAALRGIPRGQTRTYAQLAAQIGQPTAVRAVARACGANPVAVVVPCHRVVGRDGQLTGYRWGVERKRALLSAEAL